MPETVENEPERIRTRQVLLTKPMRDFLHDQWTEVKEGRHPRTGGEPRTLEQWGKELAKLIGRPRPFLKGQLSKFFTGDSTPEEIADALARYFEIPSPAIAADSVDEIRWFLVGKALLRTDPDDFRKLLRNAQARTRLNNEISELGQEVDSNPDTEES